jgi:hypothetical protein
MHRRITLVNSLDDARAWNVDENAPSRIVFGSFFRVIRHTFNGETREFGEDIERVIVDRTATDGDFLELLAHLSDNFAGDVIFIRDGDNAYVSAVGRGGGGRVLYALRAADLRFYLETHGLVAPASVAAA